MADRASAAAEDLARASVHDASVEIVEYDSAWPALYEAERERLAPLLADAELHHFGSTAGVITGRGRVVRRGGRIAFLAGELTHEDGTLLATAVATASIRGGP